ncbi:unnamed protein product, partial [Adineta ricciae]
MRKIHWRRAPRSSLAISITLICLVIFTTMFRMRQESIVSFIYHSSPDCDQSISNASAQSSTIPPYYLLVPYHEFAMRTSISCRSYKLTEPKKDLSKFHPRHSQ